MKCWKSGGSDDEVKSTGFDFDIVLKSIGHFGRFHWIQFVLLFAITVSAGISSVSYIFTGFVPRYRCLVPQCETLTNATYYSLEDQSQHFESFVDSAVGVNSDGFNQHQCLRKTVPGVGDSLDCQVFMRQLRKLGDDATVETCPPDQVVFDDTHVKSSYVTRFGFVCTEFKLRGTFNSLVLVGQLVSSFPVGIISDRYGRKVAIAICIVVNAVAGVINAFTTSLILFGVCRLLIGMAHIGAYISSYVLLLESTLPRFTNTAGSFLALCWPSGNMILVLLAYNIRDVQWLQFGLYCPLFLNLIPLMFVKESTRWLLAKGHVKEARQNVDYMAKVNREPLPDLTRQDADITEEKSPQRGSLVDLFRARKILARTLNWFYQWFCIAATTYGLIFASTSLVGNPYVNFLIVAAVGFPARLSGAYLFDRLGRRKSLIILQAIAGACTVACAQILTDASLGTLQVVLATVAKFCSSMAFMLIYIYVAEMYPTSIRSTAIGACSSVSRLGGIFALSIEFLKKYWVPLPLTLYGGMTLIAAGLATFFPETAGNKLPETMQEALEDVGKNHQLKPWCGPSKIAHINEAHQRD